MISRIIDGVVMLGGGLIVGSLLVTPVQHVAQEPAVSQRSVTVADPVTGPGPAVEVSQCVPGKWQTARPRVSGQRPMPQIYRDIIGGRALPSNP